jgi:hypothetical protein
MINFSLVDVKNINSHVPRSNFAETDLDSLADIILESGGIIRPLVVKATGAETYTVVDGHLEYYTAVRAREKNPRKGEMVNAFVISPKIEDIVTKQAASLREVESPGKVEPISKTTNLEPRLANLELRFEKQFNELKSELAQERRRVDDKFKEFATQIPQRSNPLNLLNTLDKDELYLKLQRARVPGFEKIAKAIVDARRNKKPKQEFEDYRDVVKSVKGLGEKTMLTIIDEWSRS